MRGSQFDGHVRAVLLNGIAFGGFNVVDIHALAAALARPVLVVARRAPRLALIRERARAPAGRRREVAPDRTGRADGAAARRLRPARRAVAARGARLLAATTLHGNLPEPLRLAHLIAGGITTGKSRGRA